MENEVNYLPSNIKVLREEARLSVEEFAKKANVSVNTVIGWEKGTIKIYTRDLIVICPILKISEEDIRTRNIKQERLDAYSRMKHGNSRKNFDWYYGNSKKVVFYILPLILMPLAALIGYLISLTQVEYYQALNDLWIQSGNSSINILYEYYKIIYPVIAFCFVGIVFVIIELIIRFRQYFKIWYIFIAVSFSSVILPILGILSIPYFVYCIYQVFVLKGKNRK